LDDAEQREDRDGQQHEDDYGHVADARPANQAFRRPLRFLDAALPASLRHLCGAVRGITQAAKGSRS
jgi:hypothetical protein